MTASKIDLRPKVVNLYIYAGDGVLIRLSFKDSDAAPLNMSGTVAAQVRLSHIAEDPPILEFSGDMSEAADGIIRLSLTGEQTRVLAEDSSDVKGKFLGVWDVQWTAPGADPRTFIQGKVECVTDVTR